MLVDRTLYISGQLGLDTNLKLVQGGIEKETEKVGRGGRGGFNAQNIYIFIIANNV